ncbi:phage tail protein I [Neisseria dumasiana]|uniref:Phage tail protein I n=1 Tax=Neisseria dumasiana TaxID=1931275 RepID=A0A1X3DKK8_9NEIS|nr:phage tail protein I [Neisseria dumasiana]OSI24636.1 phage tail protein I [Neisseria dumasiana]
MSVLPNSSTALQHALARLTEQETAAIDWRVIIESKDPAVCDPKWLPWLAWENSIGDAEGWSFAETEEARRRVVADYVRRHQLKGTPAAIRTLFRDLQLGEVEILERAARLRWNGKENFDGRNVFGGAPGDWAKYAVVLKRVVSVRQAEVIKQILAEIAPARCELLYLDYRATALMWDGEITFDGNYTFGAVNG